MRLTLNSDIYFRCGNAQQQSSMSASLIGQLDFTHPCIEIFSTFSPDSWVLLDTSELSTLIRGLRDGTPFSAVDLNRSMDIIYFIDIWDISIRITGMHLTLFHQLFHILGTDWALAHNFSLSFLLRRILVPLTTCLFSFVFSCTSQVFETSIGYSLLCFACYCYFCYFTIPSFTAFGTA